MTYAVYLWVLCCIFLYVAYMECVWYNVYVICAFVWYMACLCNVYGINAHGMYYIMWYVYNLCMDYVCHTHVCDCGVCSVCGLWIWMCVYFWSPRISKSARVIKAKHTSLCVWSMFWQCELQLRVKFSLYLVCLGSKMPMSPSLRNAWRLLGSHLGWLFRTLWTFSLLLIA